MNALRSVCDAKIRECSAAIKAQVASGDRGRPNETVRRLMSELNDIRADISKEIRNLHLSAGITEAEIEAVERAHEAERLPSGTDFWQHQILQTRPAEDLDAQTESGLERLLHLVDRKWLREPPDSNRRPLPRGCNSQS